MARGRGTFHLDSARNEVSGWLAGIATEEAIPHYMFWLLVDHAMDANPDNPVLYSALVVVEGIARELGIESREPLIRDDEVVAERVNALAAQIATHEGEEIRGAAAALWSQQFGKPFQPIP